MGSSSASAEDDESDSDDNKNSLAVTAKQYAAATSIHGITYIFEGGRLFLERILWVVLVVLASILAWRLSEPLFENFSQNPVLTTVSTSGYPIENVEFPAITICAQGAVNEIVGENHTLLYLQQPQV